MYTFILMTTTISFIKLKTKYNVVAVIYDCLIKICLISIKLKIDFSSKISFISMYWESLST